MPNIVLDTNHYNARMSLIYSAWTSAADYEEYNSMSNLDALLLIAGDHNEDEPPGKTSALQTWLLGYEFPSTFVLMQRNRVTFLCSSSKAKILEPIKASHPKIPVEVLALPKAKDAPKEALNTFVGLLSSAQRVGTLPKENATGKTVDEYKAALEASGTKFEAVDISVAVGAAMAIKDDDELKTTRTTCNLLTTLMSHYLVPRLELILDQEQNLSHQRFVNMIETRLGDGERAPDSKVWNKGRGLADVDFASVEFCYTPIVQSENSGYTLRIGAEPATTNIALKGVVMAALGLKYKNYCGNIARTYIVDPTPEQEALYGLILEIQSEAMKKMKDGAVAKDVYAHALSIVKEKRPDLEASFPKNIGHATGLEFREAAYLLNAKNIRVLRENMVFNLTIGFSDVPGASNGKTYCIQLSDTVKIGQDHGVFMTDAARTAKDCMFFTLQEDSKAKPKANDNKAGKASANGRKPESTQNKVVGNKVLRTKTRGANAAAAVQTTQMKIAAHQKELHARRQTDGLAKYEADGGAGAGGERKTWKKFASYKGEAGLPTEIRDPRIYIDKKNSTVILPIHGFAVPFHINTIKNANKNDEGEYTYLRINFQTPGQLTGKKEDTPFEDPDATFIRSVTYRSQDRARFDKIATDITTLKRDVNKREQQRKEMADVVEQEALVEVKGRRPHKLGDVFPRPQLEGKRLPGDVEIHQNGLRFTSMSHQRIDVLFSNIRHLFFQPCDNELIVLIHCHLKSPVMIGKKKTKDIQFYREATDMAFDETGNRKRKFRYGDEDEIEMEQAERKRRSQLNKEFKAFAEKISEAASNSGGDPIELDIPYTELSFEGVPHRTNVKLTPTMDCLVHLSELPFTVITLADVEIASLERVQFGLKQFDLVFVFSDFTRAPFQVNSIPSLQLDNVKEWLNDVDVPLAESRVNYNWGPIMKTINDNPYEFFVTGGWSFLTGETEDGEQESDPSEEESDYKSESEAYSESSEDSESDFDDDASASDGGSFGSGSGSETGEDWDDLERKAAKSDKKKFESGRGHDSDEGPKKKKPAPGKNGKAPVKGKR